MTTLRSTWNRLAAAALSWWRADERPAAPAPPEPDYSVTATAFVGLPPCAAEVDVAIFGPGTLDEVVARKAACHRRIEADRVTHGAYLSR